MSLFEIRKLFLQYNKEYKFNYEYENIIDRFMLSFINDHTQLSNTELKQSLTNLKATDKCIVKFNEELREKYIYKFNFSNCQSLLKMNNKFSAYNDWNERKYAEIKWKLMSSLQWSSQNNSIKSDCVDRYMAVGVHRSQHWMINDAMQRELFSTHAQIVQCFASPFNHLRQTNTASKEIFYCSLFKDDQLYFGSQGSFFDLDLQVVCSKFESVCLEINPPFIESILEKTVTKISPLISICKIFIITPLWKDAQFHLDLQKLNLNQKVVNCTFHDTLDNTINHNIKSVVWSNLDQ